MNHVSTYTNIFKADIDQYIYIYIYILYIYIYTYIHIYTYGHFQKMGVRWFIWENPIKIDDLEVPLSQEIVIKTK